MILGVDANQMAGRRTGVGRYLEQLILAWSRQDLPFDRVHLFAPTEIEGMPRDERFRTIVLPSRAPGVIWQTARVGRAQPRVAVLFGQYSLPLGYRCRSVVFNHGVLEGPLRSTARGIRARGRSWHFAHSARTADAVITNSATTTADLVRYYRVRREKITIIPFAVDDRFRRPENGARVDQAVEAILGERTPYFLFVGKLSVRRNVPSLLAAIAEVARERPDLRLLLVGPSTAGIDVATIAGSLGVSDQVVHVDYLDAETIALLYRGALALLMPTEREGFSLPILEAFASGCPVLTLRGAGLGVLDHLRDAVGAEADEAVLQIEDARPASLAAAMRRLADDNALRDGLRQHGLRCAAVFGSWDDVAAETAELLAGVARRSSRTSRQAITS